jgi:hypothetical protein
MSQTAQDLSVRPTHINPAEANFYITMAVLAGAEFVWRQPLIGRSWAIKNAFMACGRHDTQYEAAVAYLKWKGINVEWKP